MVLEHDVGYRRGKGDIGKNLVPELWMLSQECHNA
jgi:hypothetical protein